MCGGFVGDIIDGVGDLIEGVGDVVGDVVEGVVDAVGDVAEGVIDVVSDVGSAIDDFVNDVIPGGWGGVAGLGLLAVGIANPTLLGLAEGGALTTEAVAAAGLDAAAVAEAVAAVAPEVLAATEAAVVSGIAPEVIAMANATLDPIAALNAAAGWTTADVAYLATIGATPELIALAETNNAALAAGGGATEGGAAAGGTEGGAAGGAEGGATTQPGVTTNPDGSTVQVFDDGSTLTTAADGTVTSTPATDVITPGGNLAPVEDLSGTGVPGTNNPYGNGDIPLGTALKDYAGAVYDTLGPLGTAGALGGAALASGLLNPVSAQGGADNRTVSYEWGQGTPLVSPGLNPGYIGYPASMPDYETTSPTQSQFYWGVRPAVNTEEQLANFNQLPAGAPETPWGMATSAVGGTQQFNVPEFINQFVTNPAYAGVMSGTAPGLPVAPVAPTPAPVPLSMAQQAMAARSNSGAPTAQLTAGPVVPV